MPSVEERLRVMPSVGERLAVALVRRDPSVRTKNDKTKREKRAEMMLTRCSSLSLLC